MSLNVIIAAVGVLSFADTREAAADRAVVVELGAATPFDARELAAALRVRLAVEGAPVHVRVTATSDGVRIESHGSAREVPLHGLTGSDAARLVALSASDFVYDDLAVAPIEPGTRSRSITVGLSGGAAAWDGVLGGITLDVALPRGAWLAAIELGGSRLVAGPVELTSGIVRIAGGRRDGWFETRAGITVAPVIVTSGNGDRTVLLGAGVSERLRVPVTKRMHAIFAVGVDGYATRTQYASAGMHVTTTPRWAPWLAAGVEVTP